MREDEIWHLKRVTSSISPSIISLHLLQAQHSLPPSLKIQFIWNTFWRFTLFDDINNKKFWVLLLATSDLGTWWIAVRFPNPITRQPKASDPGNLPVIIKPHQFSSSSSILMILIIIMNHQKNCSSWCIQSECDSMWLSAAGKQSFATVTSNYIFNRHHHHHHRDRGARIQFKRVHWIIVVLNSS